MHTIEQVLDLDAMRTEIADLGEQVAAPDLWDDQANAARVTGRLSLLQSDLDRFTNLQDRLDDLSVLLELAQEESDADTLKEAESDLVKIFTICPGPCRDWLNTFPEHVCYCARFG